MLARLEPLEPPPCGVPEMLRGAPVSSVPPLRDSVGKNTPQAEPWKIGSRIQGEDAAGNSEANACCGVIVDGNRASVVILHQTPRLPTPVTVGSPLRVQALQPVGRAPGIATRCQAYNWLYTWSSGNDFIREFHVRFEFPKGVKNIARIPRNAKASLAVKSTGAEVGELSSKVAITRGLGGENNASSNKENAKGQTIERVYKRTSSTSVLKGRRRRGRIYVRRITDIFQDVDVNYSTETAAAA
ncbi:hypothetical protein C8R47DRAFT_1084017 [Mycena vitilis]|nr:hypothetical protein C8R47DRAFT_1084017 [Mycena vitilis]